MSGRQMNLDVSAYTDKELINLFSLPLTYTIQDVFSSYSRMAKTKSCKNPSVRLFLDNAKKRLEEAKMNKQDTWASQRTQLMEGTERPVILNPNHNTGFDSEISGGALANDNQGNPGWLNPINVKTRTQTLNFDSRFRDLTKFPSPLTFSFELPVEQNKVIGMRIAYVSSSSPIVPGPNNQYIYLEIKDGCQNTSNPFVAVTDVGSLSGDIITRVDNPTSGGIGLDSVDFENYLEHQREYFGPVTIKKLDFSLLDYKGTPLGTLTDQNTDEIWWSVSIIFTKLYD